jgi:NAD(P)H-hydrate epimerase
VNADTGAVPGEAFRATLTVAMGFLKVGNVVFPGAEYCGEIRVEDVGIPAQLAKSVQVSVPTDGDIASLLPTRSATSNKGSGGRLLVIGGSRDFVGAPALASLAAYRAGAGLVEVAVPESIEPTVGGHILEAIYRPLQEEDGQIAPDAIAAVETGMERAAALALGPGMGLSSSTVQFTQAVLRALAKAPPKHALIDADGLNALSKLGEWWKTKTPIVLTPHPGEMSRLTGLPIAEIQSDRLGVARRYAAEWEKIVVLKGAGTVVADPSGEAVVNPTGGPNLATAGTGDVLSGVIGGLLAQGVRPFPAAVAGVYIHGRAGDLLRAEHGDVGTLAGDLLGMLPRARLSILANTQEAL